MKMFVDAPAIYLYPGQVDFRKSINGLALIVEQEGTYSPFDEALFVFCNRNRDKVKALYWDKPAFASGTNAWRKIFSVRPRWDNRQCNSPKSSGAGSSPVSTSIKCARTRRSTAP